MLRFAFHYQKQLQDAFEKRSYDADMKYIFVPYQFFKLRFEETTEHKFQFVSVDNNDNVIGYHAFNVDWRLRHADKLHNINFGKKSVVFAGDYMELLHVIFVQYALRKLKFQVVVGNPVEQMHDRIIKKYGGRVVGVFREEVVLADGQYYDYKHYEILRDDFFKSLKSLKYDPQSFIEKRRGLQ
jgi:hypothetical protein